MADADDTRLSTSPFSSYVQGSAVNVEATRRGVRQYAVLESELDSLANSTTWTTLFGALSSLALSFGGSCWLAEWSAQLSDLQRPVIALAKVLGLVVGLVFAALAAWSFRSTQSLLKEIRSSSRPLEVSPVVVVADERP